MIAIDEWSKWMDWYRRQRAKPLGRSKVVVGYWTTTLTDLHRVWWVDNRLNLGVVRAIHQKCIPCHWSKSLVVAVAAVADLRTMIAGNSDAVDTCETDSKDCCCFVVVVVVALDLTLAHCFVSIVSIRERSVRDIRDGVQ